MITWEQIRDGIQSGWYRCEEYHHQQNACYEYDDDEKIFQFTFDVGEFGRTQTVFVRYVALKNLGFMMVIDSPIGLVEDFSKSDLFDLLYDARGYGLSRLENFVCLRYWHTFDYRYYSAEDLSDVIDCILNSSFHVATDADRLEKKYLGLDMA